jgi:hypothetical protein
MQCGDGIVVTGQVFVTAAPLSQQQQSPPLQRLCLPRMYIQ